MDLNQIDVNALFDKYSQAAAKSERNGCFAKAQTEWDRAALYAQSNKQKEWCQNRSTFCGRVVRRPFKGE